MSAEHTELLANLVRALNSTKWSAFQDKSNFMGELEAADIAVFPMPPRSTSTLDAMKYSVQTDGAFSIQNPEAGAPWLTPRTYIAVQAMSGLLAQPARTAIPGLTKETAEYACRMADSMLEALAAAVPIKPPASEINAELLQALKHAMRYWDQLSLSDVDEYRAVIAKAEGRA